MSNLDKYFKGQHENEEFICFFRQHWIVLLKELFYFLIFVVVAIISVININLLKSLIKDNGEFQIFFVIGFLLGTVFVHRFFLHMFNHFINIGIITDMRIIEHEKTLFLRDTLEEIDMLNVQDIERKGEGLLPNFLGYGDIDIYLAASSTVKVFHHVPNAKFHFRCISRQKELRRMNKDTNTSDEKIENPDAIDQQRQILTEGLKGMDKTAN
jgi:hypothetical protein